MSQQNSIDGDEQIIQYTRVGFLNITHNANTSPRTCNNESSSQHTYSIDISKDTLKKQQYLKGSEFELLPNKLTITPLFSQYSNYVYKQHHYTSKPRYKSHRIPKTKKRLQDYSTNIKTDYSKLTNQNNNLEILKNCDNNLEQETSKQNTGKDCLDNNQSNHSQSLEISNKQVVTGENLKEPPKIQNSIDGQFIEYHSHKSASQLNSLDCIEQIDLSDQIDNQQIKKNIPKDTNESHQLNSKLSHISLLNGDKEQLEANEIIKVSGEHSSQSELEEGKVTLDALIISNFSPKSINSKVDRQNKEQSTNRLYQSENQSGRITPLDDTDNTISKESNNLTETSFYAERRIPLEITAQKNTDSTKHFYNTVHTSDSINHNGKLEKNQKSVFSRELIGNNTNKQSHLDKQLSLLIDISQEGETSNQNQNETSEKRHKKKSCISEKIVRMKKNVSSNDHNVSSTENNYSNQTSNSNTHNHTFKETKMFTIKDIEQSTEPYELNRILKEKDFNYQQNSLGQKESNEDFRKQITSSVNLNENNSQKRSGTFISTNKYRETNKLQSDPNSRYDSNVQLDNNFKNQFTRGNVIINTQSFNILQSHNTCNQHKVKQNNNNYCPIETFQHSIENSNIQESKQQLYQPYDNNIDFVNKSLKESYLSQKQYVNNNYHYTQNPTNYSTVIPSNRNNILIKTTDNDNLSYSKTNDNQLSNTETKKENGKNTSNNLSNKVNIYEPEMTNINITYPQFLSLTEQDELSLYLDSAKKTPIKIENDQEGSNKTNNKQYRPLELLSIQSTPEDQTGRFQTMRNNNNNPNQDTNYFINQNNISSYIQISAQKHLNSLEKDRHCENYPYNKQMIYTPSSIQTESYHTYCKQYDNNSPIGNKELIYEYNKYDNYVIKEENTNINEQNQTKADMNINENSYNYETTNNHLNYQNQDQRSLQNEIQPTKEQKPKIIESEAQKQDNNFYLYYSYVNQKAKDLSYIRHKEIIDQLRDKKSSLFETNIIKQNLSKEVLYTSPTDNYYTTGYNTSDQINRYTLTDRVFTSSYSSNKLTTMDIIEEKRKQFLKNNKSVKDLKIQITNSNANMNTNINKKSNLHRHHTLSNIRTVDKTKHSNTNLDSVNSKYAKLFCNLDDYKKRKLKLI